MARNISFALTTPQFLDGSKDVTRRMGWRNLKAADVLCAVEKGMGLKPGEKIKRLGMIRVVSVRREPLTAITQADVVREGFPNMTPAWFIEFFCAGHKGCTPESEVTQIEFEHISTDTPTEGE